MHIFIGSREVAGIGRSLALGFRELGHDAHLVTSLSHPFSYNGKDKVGGALKLWRWLGDIAARPGNIVVRLLARALNRLASFFVLLWAAARFDAFLFLFGSTITSTGFELYLLRRLRKRLIFVYLGSDVRPPYMDGFYLLSAGVDRNPDNIRRVTRRLVARLRRQERYADHLVNAPGTAQFGYREYVNSFAIGMPVARDPRRAPSDAIRPGQQVRVLHCPSHPIAKGSAAIRDAIGALLDKGHMIDFVELTGVPNSVVVDELMRCDFIVDQVYSDTPMAMFAAEAASIGVPSVVAGYFAKAAQGFIAPQDRPPSLYVTPTGLQDAIEKMVVDTEYRRDLGRRAREFIETRWSPRQVAARYIRLIEGDAPAGWLLHPSDSIYASGAGAPEEMLGQAIAELVGRHGEAALHVDDKPRLRRELLRLAGLG